MPNGQAIGDGAHTTDPFGGPIPTGSLQHPGLARVGDDERVVIVLLVAETAVPSLAVGVQQLDNEVKRCTRRAGSLQRQPDNVHADQAGLFVIGFLGKDRLIGDGQATLVGAHLAPPDPEGLGKQDLVGLWHLRDLDVGALDGGAGFVRGSWNPGQDVGFVGLAVAVLGQNDCAVSGCFSGCDQGITHIPSPSYSVKASPLLPICQRSTAG